MIFHSKLWIPQFFILAFAVSTSAFKIGPGASGTAWEWYKNALGKRPLLTKSLTSSAMMTLSDAICQRLTATSDPMKADIFDLDISRVLQVGFTGLTWSGPITHFWYGTLEKIVKIQDPMLGLIVRLLLDSIIFSPVTITGYFIWRSALEGGGIQEAREKLSTRFRSTLLGAWKFWPAVNVINFGFVPVELRVLYSNVLSLFWTGYLTYVNSKKSLSS